MTKPKPGLRRFYHTRRFGRMTRRPREWVAVHAAALRREPTVRRAFEAAIRAAQNAVPIEMVELALERHDAGGAAAAFPWAVFARAFERDALPALTEAFGAAGAAAVRTLGSELDVPVEVKKADLLALFNVRNPRATAWIASRGAELVRNVTIESQAAIRRIVLTAYQRGVDVRGQATQIARVLRRGVGLTERQARALGNMEDGLLRAGNSAVQVERAVEQARGRMIAQRAKAIARTETMIAAAGGQQEAWAQARDQGLLPADQKRRWLAQPGVDEANPCPICEGLDGQERSMSEDFVSDYDGTRVARPPAHPQCLCTVVLVFD